MSSCMYSRFQGTQMEFLSPPVARLVELGTVCPSVLPIGACGLDPFISLSAQGLGSEEPFSMRVMWVVQWLRRTVRSIGVVSPPSRLRRRCETSLVFKHTGCVGNFVCSPAWALPLPVSEGYISLYKGGLTRQFFIRLVPTSPVQNRQHDCSRQPDWFPSPQITRPRLPPASVPSGRWQVAEIKGHQRHEVFIWDPRRASCTFLPQLSSHSAQVNSRTHRPQKLKCLISLCTNPVSILSVPFQTVR
jgi:hypothetical protein